MGLIANLDISMSVHLGEFNKQLKAASTQLKRFKHQVEKSFRDTKTVFMRMGIAVAGVTAAVEALGRAIATVDAEIKRARAIGLSWIEMQKLGRAADHLGASIDDIVPAIQRLQRRLGDAVKGSKPLQEAFESLGISLEQAEQMSELELFFAVSNGLGDIASSSEQAATGAKLLDDQWKVLVPIAGDLQQEYGKVSKHIDEMTEGMSMNAAEVEAANDAYNDVKDDLYLLWKLMVGKLAPALKWLSDTWTNSNKSMSQSTQNWLTAITPHFKAVNMFYHGIIEAQKETVKETKKTEREMRQHWQKVSGGKVTFAPTMTAEEIKQENAKATQAYQNSWRTGIESVTSLAKQGWADVSQAAANTLSVYMMQAGITLGKVGDKMRQKVDETTEPLTNLLQGAAAAGMGSQSAATAINRKVQKKMEKDIEKTANASEQTANALNWIRERMQDFSFSLVQ